MTPNNRVESQPPSRHDYTHKECRYVELFKRNEPLFNANLLLAMNVLDGIVSVYRDEREHLPELLRLYTTLARAKQPTEILARNIQFLASPSEFYLIRATTGLECFNYEQAAKRIIWCSLYQNRRLQQLRRVFDSYIKSFRVFRLQFNELTPYEQHVIVKRLNAPLFVFLSSPSATECWIVRRMVNQWRNAHNALTAANFGLGLVRPVRPMQRPIGSVADILQRMRPFDPARGLGEISHSEQETSKEP